MKNLSCAISTISPAPFRGTLWACILVSFATACGDSPVLNAVGPYSDVAILTSTKVLMPVARTLELQFEEPVEYSLETESILHAQIFDMADRKQALASKNVVVIGFLDGEDDASRELQRQLKGERMKGISPRELYVATREDVYYHNQNVIFLGGYDRALMQSAIVEQGAALRGEIEIRNRQRLLAHLVSRGRKLDLEQQIYQEAGFSLIVPEDYRGTRFVRDQDRGAVEIASGRPTRALTVFWEPVESVEVLQDQDRLLQIRRQWGKDFLDESLQDAGGFTFTRELLLETEVPMLGGFWEGETYGGPFRTLFYHDEVSRRLYGLNLMTYAPGMDKHPYMREVHAIAETFRPKP